MEYPGALHHAVNRGDRREQISHDDIDPAALSLCR
jgi:hypothetical protein